VHDIPCTSRVTIRAHTLVDVDNGAYQYASHKCLCSPYFLLRYPCHDDASRRSGALPVGLRQQRAGLLTNAATPLIFNLKRSDHISDALQSLHWLRVPERIQYKVAVLGYQVLHGSAPR